MPVPAPDRLDRTLLAAGVVGLVLFLIVLPRYHPDAAGTFGIGKVEATERAAAFAEQSGYAVDGFVPAARLARSSSFVDSLQATLGRRGAILALQEGWRDNLPAFFWHVEWYDEAESRSEGPVVDVRVLPNGSPWSILPRRDHLPSRSVDLDALESILGPGRELPPDVRQEGFLSFDISEAVDITDEPLPETSLENGAAGLLGARAAVAIAGVHLARTIQPELGLRATRVEPLQAHGRGAVRVIFERPEPVLGQELSTSVDVGSTGTLLGIETTFNGVAERMSSAGTIVFGTSGSTLLNVLKYGGYAALILFLLVVTLRRLTTRTLDTRAALKDALAVGVMSAASIVFHARFFWHDLALEPVGFYIVMLVVVLSNGFILAVIGFITTGGGDALARLHDDRPIRTFALARDFSILNVPVGRAILHGLGVGGALLGLAAVLMWVFGESMISAEPMSVYLPSQNSLLLIGQVSAGSFWYALVYVFAVFVSLGAVLGRWRPALTVPGLALVISLLGMSTIRVPMGSAVVAWICMFAVGLLLALAFRRTDALSVLLALTVAGTVWGLSEPLLLPGSPAVLDLVVGGVLIVVLIGVGVWGYRSDRTAASLPFYEPEFVVEQRERARLQRELEIAREVQQSFLPRSVPEIAGLDLAARCVPAEEVGGDYYDLVPLGGGKLAVIIGDVSGKGIQAAFYMTLVKGYIQSLAGEIERPALVLKRLNGLFRRSVPRGIFVSMIYGVIDVEERTITFARGGHTPLVIKRTDGGMETLRPAGIAIGMADDAIFASAITEETVTLATDDLMVLYTDGVSEAMDARRSEFTDERVLAAVDRAPNRAESVLNGIVADVQRHVGGARQHDDITTVVVRIADSHHEALSSSLLTSSHG